LEVGSVAYRPGDVLTIECPFTEVTVTGASRCHVSMRWPWWEVDAQADGIEWWRQSEVW